MIFITQRFIEMRKELGLTQTEYGKLLNLSRPTVGAYEEGRARPSVETISKIMEISNIPKEDMHAFIFEKDYILPALI